MVSIQIHRQPALGISGQCPQVGLLGFILRHPVPLAHIPAASSIPTRAIFLSVGSLTVGFKEVLAQGTAASCRHLLQRSGGLSPAADGITQASPPQQLVGAVLLTPHRLRSAGLRVGSPEASGSSRKSRGGPMREPLDRATWCVWGDKKSHSGAGNGVRVRVGGGAPLGHWGGGKIGGWEGSLRGGGAYC